ncbi:MAG: DUF2378 family protein [Chloroflexota bacterium]|nr:DUF2378 family protein [Chloroflexota bacterium]
MNTSTLTVNQVEVITSNYLVNLLLVNGKLNRMGLKSKIQEKLNYNIENLPTTIPFSDYMRVVEFIRQEYYSQLNRNVAYELIGYQSSLEFLNSPLGQVLKLAAGVLGTQRGLHQFIKTMRTVMPFGKHHLEELTPHYVIYQMRDIDVPPALVCGWLRASLEITQTKSKRIKAEEIGPRMVHYHLEWA